MGILTKFKLETDYDALINHYGLDIEQEEDFNNHIIQNVEPKGVSALNDTLLEYYFTTWYKHIREY